MFTAKNVAIGLGVILVIFLAIVGRFAYEQHVALAKANDVVAASQKTLTDLVQKMADRDKADVQQQDQAKTDAAKVKTSADAVQVITKYVTLPPVPAGAPPATAVVAKQDFTATEQAKLPDSTSYVVQTQDAATATAKELISCGADRSSLTTCKSDLADSVTMVATVKKESDTWEATAKGGTKSQRFVKFLKCAAFAGAGAAGGAITKQPMWAGVGAAAGVTACQLF